MLQDRFRAFRRRVWSASSKLVSTVDARAQAREDHPRPSVRLAGFRRSVPAEAISQGPGGLAARIEDTKHWNRRMNLWFFG